MLLGDRSKCTRKRPLHQNAARRRQQGGVSRSSKYGRDVPWLFTAPKDPPRASFIAFEPGHGVGGRR